jgi:T5SS/PEP-CTERM-associated repeat protein
MNTLLLLVPCLRPAPVSRLTDVITRRRLLFWLTLSFLAILASPDARADLTLDSGSITVETNAVHDGTNEDPKSDSAPRNAFPGDAQLNVQSQKIVGQNGMTSTAGSILQSRMFGTSFLLSGSAGPSANGFINNPTGAGTFVGTGRGRVAYTFTLTSSYSFSLSWLASGQVKNSAGTTLNPPGNNARVRIIGVFDESIVGTDRKEGTATGILSPGTYTVEGIAATEAMNAQTSRANFSFGLGLAPVNRWINPAGGVFQISGNWEAGTVPAGQDAALFDLPGTYTVALSNDVSHGGLQMHGSGVNVTLELGGDSYTLGGPLQVGGLEGDSVSLRVRGSGGIISSAAPGEGSDPPDAPNPGDDDVFSMPQLQLAAGSSIVFENRLSAVAPGGTVEGILTLKGEQGVLTTEGTLSIGVRAPDARIIVSEEAFLLTNRTVLGVEPGSLLTDPGKGSIFINDGSTWQSSGLLTVGAGGQGAIGISSGGRLVAQNLCVLGQDEGSIGALVVSGTFEAPSLLVGILGEGSVQVQASGTVDVSILDITSGNMKVSGSVSQAKVQDSISVGGGENSATLLVEDSGLITRNFAPMTTSIKKNGSLRIGPLGAFSGTDLEVNSQGSLVVISSVATAARARIGSGASATITAAAELVLSQSLRVDGALAVDLSSNVTVGTGSTTIAAVRINPGGVLSGTGTIIADNIVLAGDATDEFTGARLRPGDSPGTLTLDGNYTQESGAELIMEIAGTNAGANHDQLVITGNANLGGTLVLQFLDGFIPNQGDQFALLDIGGAITGEFESVEISGLEPGFEFNVLPDGSGNLVLTALNDGVPQRSKGKYRGLLLTDPFVHATAGFFNIQVSARHSFTAKFVLGGETFKVKGKFDADGKFTGTATGKSGTSVTVSFVLSLVNDQRAIVGTITVGNQAIALAAKQTKAFNKKTNPAPQAGKYTMLLPFDPQDTDAPKANGYGLVTVGPTGAIRFAGALPDGTRLAQSTVLSSVGEWPFYLPLYKKGGSLAGLIQFQDLPGSDFDGLLHWTRPADAEKEIPGFVTTLPAVGSKYVAPPARPAVLDFPNPNGATFTLNDPNESLLLTKSLTLTPPARFTVTNPAADALSLSVKAGSGLLSGRLIHPSDSVKTKLQGVVLQKQNFGTGFAPTSGGPASFELRQNLQAP